MSVDLKTCHNVSAASTNAVSSVAVLTCVVLIVLAGMSAVTAAYACVRYQNSKKNYAWQADYYSKDWQAERFLAVLDHLPARAKGEADRASSHKEAVLAIIYKE